MFEKTSLASLSRVFEKELRNNWQLHLKGLKKSQQLNLF